MLKADEISRWRQAKSAPSRRAIRIGEGERGLWARQRLAIAAESPASLGWARKTTSRRQKRRQKRVESLEGVASVAKCPQDHQKPRDFRQSTPSSKPRCRAGKRINILNAAKINKTPARLGIRRYRRESTMLSPVAHLRHRSRPGRHDESVVANTKLPHKASA